MFRYIISYFPGTTLHWVFTWLILALNHWVFRALMVPSLQLFIWTVLPFFKHCSISASLSFSAHPRIVSPRELTEWWLVPFPAFFYLNFWQVIHVLHQSVSVNAPTIGHYCTVMLCVASTVWHPFLLSLYVILASFRFLIALFQLSTRTSDPLLINNVSRDTACLLALLSKAIPWIIPWYPVLTLKINSGS